MNHRLANKHDHPKLLTTANLLPLKTYQDYLIRQNAIRLLFLSSEYLLFTIGLEDHQTNKEQLFRIYRVRSFTNNSYIGYLEDWQNDTSRNLQMSPFQLYTNKKLNLATKYQN
jgi:hypothetical protein